MKYESINKSGCVHMSACVFPFYASLLYYLVRVTWSKLVYSVISKDFEKCK